MNTYETKPSHTDIRREGLAIRLCPAPLHPYALLMRLDRPIGIWLLLLPGWWSIVLAAGGARAMNAHDLFLFALFGAGAVIMRGAGCVINDLWDRDLDRTVARTRGRPLASGEITPRRALAFLALLLAAGLAVLLQTGITCILLGVATIPLIALYPLMKRITWWPQLFLGVTFNFGALMGWAAVTGTVGLPAVLLYTGGIFWTLAYDTVYAHQDREDDMRAGIKSTALLLAGRSRLWVAGFHAAAFVPWAAALAAAHAGTAGFIVLALSALLAARGVARWDMADSVSSLSLFRAARHTGLLLLLAAAL